MFKIDAHMGIQLDIGCGEVKRENFVRLDKRKLPGIDIVHDLEVFPYPLPDDCCLTIVGSHLIEHIKPWFRHQMFNELWRITKVGGRLALNTPYAGSFAFHQDMTHVGPGYNEASFQYLDPRYPLWKIYKLKPWTIVTGFPMWQVNGNLEVVLEKIKEAKDEPRGRDQGRKR